MALTLTFSIELIIPSAITGLGSILLLGVAAVRVGILVLAIGTQMIFKAADNISGFLSIYDILGVAVKGFTDMAGLLLQPCRKLFT